MKALRVGRAEALWRRGDPQIKIVMSAREAVDFGRWMQDEKFGDKELGAELVKLGHEAWEDER